MTAPTQRHPSTRDIIGTAAALGAVILGAATKTRQTRRMDRRVRRAVHPKRGPRVVKLAKGVSFLASPKALPWMALAACVAVSKAKGQLSLAPLVAFLSAAAIDKGARFVVHQRRPRKASRHKGRDRFAYPSGHTSGATAIALAAAIALADGRSRRDRVLLYSLAGLYSAVVGWSRLQLDEHWFDDVVGGGAAGVAIAIGSTALTDSFAR